MTTVLVVGGVGGVAGHVLWPFAPGAGVARPAAFVALMLATGALRGWREAVVREAPAVGRAALVHAIGTLVLALVGYAAMHGTPG
ncbi:MAG: hypothetical protein ACXWZ4_09715 [Gemmatirosa sp.]